MVSSILKLSLLKKDKTQINKRTQKKTTERLMVIYLQTNGFCDVNY